MTTHGVTLARAARTWARIGLQSFGGPAGQIAVMHRILVEEERWIDEPRFLHALNFCMLLPGPEATQLATYVGWLMHGVRGGLLAGGLFILPGYLAILALSVAYAEYHAVGWVGAALFGLKAAVLAVVVDALLRIGRRVLRNGAMAGIAVASFVGLLAFGVPFPAVILVAGLVGLAGGRWWPTAFVVVGRDDSPALLGDVPEHARPDIPRAFRTAAVWLAIWLVPVAILHAALGRDHVMSRISAFFSQAAVVTFGGAYAVLAYVGQQAVERYGWLRPGELLDGLGMAETTPGPLIMVTEFVGFLAAYRDPGALHPLVSGFLGATLTTWVTFAPCFLWIFVLAPWVEALRGRAVLAAALSAITAAVVGVIANLAVWLAARTLLDPVSIAIAAAAAVALLWLRRGMLEVLGLAMLAGLGAWAVG